MRIKEQMELIRDALQTPFLDTESGKSFVAFDPVHMWNMLLNKPGSLRVIVCYDGEDARETFGGGSQTGMVDRHFIVAFSRGRGLNAERGDSLTEGVGGGRPLFELVEEGRDIIRAMAFKGNPECEVPIDFKRITKMQVQSPPTDAYQVQFSVGSLIGQVQVIPK